MEDVIKVTDDSDYERNLLEKCTLENTYEFPFVGDILCKVLKVIDGDTFIGAVVFNKIPYICTFRVFGINAPELHPRLDVENRDEVKNNAIIAKKWLNDMIQSKICDITMKDRDAFGRILAAVHVDSLDIGNTMIDKGYAKPFKQK